MADTPICKVICKDCKNAITKEKKTLYREIEISTSVGWWIFKKFVPKYETMSFQIDEPIHSSSWRCLKDLTNNCVDGESYYGYCHHKNRDGDCEDFEPLEEI